jgi:hypothetical protein
MSIFGKRETTKEPQSTADLAAAARHAKMTRADATSDDRPVPGQNRAKTQDHPEARDRAAADTSAEAHHRPAASTDAETWDRPTAGTSTAARDRAPASTSAEDWDRAPAGTGAEDRDRGTANAGAETREYTEAREGTDARARADIRERIGVEPRESQARSEETLEPLFTQDLAESYRMRWTSIQSGFVDDPRRAVRSGDELVAEVITNLADTFSHERRRLETQLGQSGETSTENLRVALQRYRSFFERLLAL